ncbi:MAG: hypothetical protein C0483_14180 [Pirellula sp.]|nr:hypothetical protein [Pirellula sp.]
MKTVTIHSNEDQAQRARFQVTFNGQTSTVYAADENEAWAIFCDSTKQWPGPKAPGRIVKRLK